jgi:hypothetical protein
MIKTYKYRLKDRSARKVLNAHTYRLQPSLELVRGSTARC